jgi:hypothetical protein
MNKLNATLSEVLDVEPIGSTELLPATPVTKVDDDADFARDNIRTLIEKGNLAVDGILNKDLMEIQKRKKDLAPQSQRGGDINVDKAVFVGSTTELVKFLKNNK